MDFLVGGKIKNILDGVVRMGKENQIVTYTEAKRPILYINHYDYKEIDKMIEEGAKKNRRCKNL